MNKESSHKLRWRGVESGPYEWNAIEQMLAELRIGLYHEVEHEGRWVTIRHFITQTKAQTPPSLQPSPAARIHDAPHVSQTPPVQKKRRFKLPSFKAKPQEPEAGRG